MDTMEGKDFGKYTLLDHMGKGGVADVYRASDNEEGGVLAIKIFKTAKKRPPHVARKLRDRELRMLISIQHPNVVKYYESGEIGDACYYTMEFVENSLHKHMRSGAVLSLPDKVHIMRQACNALQAIHQQGIVHRDIKPANILLDQASSGAFHVKVADLGIAKKVSEIKEKEKKQKSGRVPGTPKYLSPEQILLWPVDGRTDVFSLGISAYEFLAGKPPFKAADARGFLDANFKDEPPPLHEVNKEIPPFMDRIVSKMLSKNREDRYDSDTLARDLELVYQHLISDAELIDEEHTGSVFYVAKVRLDEGTGKLEKAMGWLKRQQLDWPQLAAMAVIAGVATVYTLLAMPPMPHPPGRNDPISLDTPERLTGTAALEKAENLLASERNWLALIYLEQIDGDELDDSQLQLKQSLLERTHRRLASPFLEKAREKADESLEEEANKLLEQVKKRFPLAG